MSHLIPDFPFLLLNVLTVSDRVDFNRLQSSWRGYSRPTTNRGRGLPFPRLPVTIIFNSLINSHDLRGRGGDLVSPEAIMRLVGT